MEGHTVNPGTVDSVIDQGAAERLREKMGDVQPPSFKVEDFSLAIDSQLRMDSFKPPQIAGGDFDYSPFDLAKLPGLAEPIGRSGAAASDAAGGASPAGWCRP